MILINTIEQYTARPNSASASARMPIELLGNSLANHSDSFHFHRTVPAEPAGLPCPNTLHSLLRARLKHHDRRRDKVGVRQRHMYIGDAQFFSSFRRPTVQPEERPAVIGRIRDFNVVPMDVPGIVTTGQRLVGRLLRGEPGRKVSSRLGAPVAVVALTFCEQPSSATERMPSQEARDTIDIGQVHSDTANHGLRRRTFRQNDPVTPRESASAGSESIHTSSAARNAR